MSTKKIFTINHVDIVVTDDNYVPIKPICEALGIDRKRQQDKIKEHPILATVGGLKPLTGADGKEYEMFCLPISMYLVGYSQSIRLMLMKRRRVV